MAETDKDGVSRNSHNCLTGGVLRVPGDAQSQFHRLYVDDCRDGHTFFFSENFTAVYRACFDLDYESLAGLDVDDNDHLAESYAVIIKAVRRFYPVDEPAKTFRCVVCRAPLKHVPESADKPAHVKTGVHLVFPHLFITKAQALHMVSAIVEALEHELGPRGSGCGSKPALRGKPHAAMRLPAAVAKAPPGALVAASRKLAWTANQWKDVCDATIHQQGNLRLPLSDKPSSCATCRNHPAATAGGPSVCGDPECNRQRLPQHRVYSPFGVMSVDGRWEDDAFEKLTRNEHCVLQLTCVRAPHRSRPSRGFQPFEGCPAPVAPSSETRATASKAKTSKAKARGGGNGEQGPSLRPHARTGTQQHLDPSDPRSLAMQDMARLVHPRYKELRCAQAILNKKPNGDTLYLFKVRGTGEKFCLNKQDEHGSSTVWFLFSPHGVSQRCWCKKPDVRVSGVTCASYRSGLMAVPMNLLRVLYPDMATASTIKGVYSKSGRRRKTAGVLGGTTVSCQRLHSQAQRERWGKPADAKLDAIAAAAAKKKNEAAADHWKGLQERSRRAHAAKTGEVYSTAKFHSDTTDNPVPSSGVVAKRRSLSELSRMPPAARDAYEKALRRVAKQTKAGLDME